jgi:hypothetical protein
MPTSAHFLDWSPGFFERLSEVDPATATDVDDLLEAIRSRRRSSTATLDDLTRVCGLKVEDWARD